MDKMSEVLLQSIQTLIDKSLEGLQFTTTEVANILNNDEAYLGKYTVSNGSVTYIAYSDNDSYQVGDQVQINIPNNKLNETKTIIGKVRTQSQEPIKYQKPSDTVLITSGNLININKESGLLANGDIITAQLNEEGTSVQAPHSEKMVITANFKTLLGSYAPIKGSYGLLITLTEQPKKSGQAGKQYKYTFSSESMVGDIYNFSGYFPQSYVCDISNISIVEKIKIELFQTKNFKDFNGKNIKIVDDLGNTLSNNIFVNNINIGFGMDIANIQEDRIRLSAAFNDFAQTNDRKIKINLAWAHIDEDGSINNIIAPEKAEPCMICWYIDGTKPEAADQYSGIFWNIINFKGQEHPKQFIYNLQNNSFITNNDQIIDINLYHNMSYELLRENKAQFNIKAIVFFRDKIYTSNILTIKNGNYTEEKRDIEFAPSKISFKITSDGQQDLGYYLFYDANGQIDDTAFKGAAEVERIITPMLNNSLIDITRYKIDWTSTDNYITHLKSADSTVFKYNINKTIATNSIAFDTITCTVTGLEEGSNESYLGSCNLYFGQTTNGTGVAMCAQLCTGLALQNKKMVYIPVEAYTIDDNKNYFVHLFLIKNDETITLSNEIEIREWPFQNSNYFNISYDNIVDQGYLPITPKEGMLEKVPKDNASIFEFTSIVQIGEESKEISCLLPIAIRTKEDYEISAPVYLNYNINSKPNPLNEIICYKNNEEIDGAWVDSNSWSLFIDKISNSKRYKVTNISSIYSQDKNMPTLCLIDSQENCLYSIPFVITQNRFGINLLNQWNGDLMVDKENNYILSAMIGAGRKNKDNSFSGVMLGDLTQAGSESYYNQMTGIYGFDSGELTYALREDGSFYLGGKGVIQSVNYEEDNSGIPVSGTKIDLTDGSIKASELNIQDIFTIYPKTENNEGYIEINAEKLQISGSSDLKNFDEYLKDTQTSKVWYWDTEGQEPWNDHKPTSEQIAGTEYGDTISIDIKDDNNIIICSYIYTCVKSDETNDKKAEITQITPLNADLTNNKYQTSDWWVNQIKQIYQLQDGKWELVSDTNKFKEIERELNSIGLELNKEKGTFTIKAEKDLATFYNLDESGKVLLAPESVKVVGKNYTFDTEGLNITSSDSNITTLINNDGMSVKVDNKDTLVANNQGVDAIDLTAHKYLVIDNGASKNENEYFGCRFTTYKNKRIGCFYVS